MNIAIKADWVLVAEAANEIGMEASEVEAIVRKAGVKTRSGQKGGRGDLLLNRDDWEAVWCEHHGLTTDRPRLRFQYVYFIGAPTARKVKIGTTHRDPRWRFLRIQASSPIEVMAVSCLLGGAKHEASLHKVFKEYRCHAEWFHCKGKLLDFLLNHTDDWMEGESRRFVSHQFAYFDAMHRVWEKRLSELVETLNPDFRP